MHIFRFPIELCTIISGLNVVAFRKEFSALCQHSEEISNSVSLLYKLVLQNQPNGDVGKKKEDDVAQFCKGYSAIIDQCKFMPGDIENP